MPVVHFLHLPQLLSYYLDELFFSEESDGYHLKHGDLLDAAVRHALFHYHLNCRCLDVVLQYLLGLLTELKLIWRHYLVVSQEIPEVGALTLLFLVIRAKDATKHGVD